MTMATLAKLIVLGSLVAMLLVCATSLALTMSALRRSEAADLCQKLRAHNPVRAELVCQEDQ